MVHATVLLYTDMPKRRSNRTSSRPRTVPRLPAEIIERIVKVMDPVTRQRARSTARDWNDPVVREREEMRRRQEEPLLKRFNVVFNSIKANRVHQWAYIMAMHIKPPDEFINDDLPICMEFARQCSTAEQGRKFIHDLALYQQFSTWRNQRLSARLWSHGAPRPEHTPRKVARLYGLRRQQVAGFINATREAADAIRIAETLRDQGVHKDTKSLIQEGYLFAGHNYEEIEYDLLSMLNHFQARCFESPDDAGRLFLTLARMHKAYRDAATASFDAYKKARRSLFQYVGRHSSSRSPQAKWTRDVHRIDLPNLSYAIHDHPAFMPPPRKDMSDPVFQNFNTALIDFAMQLSDFEGMADTQNVDHRNANLLQHPFLQWIMQRT